MRVTINEKGVIVIKAENTLDHYALSKWIEEDKKLRPTDEMIAAKDARFIIVTDWIERNN